MLENLFCLLIFVAGMGFILWHPRIFGWADLDSELRGLLDSSDPDEANPYKDVPGYQHILPSQVICKRWDTLSAAEKDVDFWARTHTLADQLAASGETRTLSGLRQRYEEARQEEHDLEHRTSFRRLDGMEEFVFPKEITVDAFNCDIAKRVWLTVKDEGMFLTPEVALMLAVKLRTSALELQAVNTEDNSWNDAETGRTRGGKIS